MYGIEIQICFPRGSARMGCLAAIVIFVSNMPPYNTTFLCFFEIFIFLRFSLAFFDIFPYITLINLWFHATRHSFSPRNVIFGLREPCTVWKLKTFENFQNFHF